MPKAKLSDFKKYIVEMNEAQLRNELVKLFSKINQVKDFYAQDLLSDEDKKKVLEECKEKIYKEFWTSSGNPRKPSNAKIRTLISNFEKISSDPSLTVELLLYRVRVATEFANDFGGAPDGVYSSSSNAFEKAVALIYEYNLIDKFKDQCEDLFGFDNLDYWYAESLEEIYENVFGE